MSDLCLKDGGELLANLALNIKESFLDFFGKENDFRVVSDFMEKHTRYVFPCLENKFNLLLYIKLCLSCCEIFSESIVVTAVAIGIVKTKLDGGSSQYGRAHSKHVQVYKKHLAVLTCEVLCCQEKIECGL